MLTTVRTGTGVEIENTDIKRLSEGAVEVEQLLPNNIRFGGRVRGCSSYAALDIWIDNGTDDTLTDLNFVTCLMLRGARGFTRQNQDGKIYRDGVAAVSSEDGSRWILISFDIANEKTDGNYLVPCIHCDSQFPQVPAGGRVTAKGRIWFYEGRDIEAEIANAKQFITAM